MSQTHRRTRFGRTIVLACSGLAGLACTPALGQNELGDGRGLEIRQQLGGPTDRGSRRARFDRDLRFTNAVVTGNAPGGLSFRGDLGYTAGAEFRSELGSNDLFAFRRDSLNSGLAGYGIRGTRAIQYQFSLTTGQRSPSGLIGSPTVLRSGTGMTAAMLSDPTLRTPGARPLPGTGAARLDPRLADALRLDGSMLGTLRSTSSYLANEAHLPVVLGTMVNDAGQRQGVIASPLTGLHQTLLDEPPSGPRGDPPTRVGTSYDLLVSSLADMSAAVDPVERPRADWEIKLDEIRARLFEPGVDGAIGDGGAPDEAMDETVDLLDRLRDRVGTLPSFLVGTLDPGEAYTLHMLAGERLMGIGSYFDAEERFTRALASQPDDIAAQIARVHAQLGAGMLRSAHQNLRSLLVAHPEISAQRYGPGLLPSDERSDALAAELRANLSAPGFARESALLASYLGYQRGDRDAIEAGLETLGRSDVGTDATLADLLERVWLAPSVGDDAAEPGPAKPAPAGTVPTEPAPSQDDAPGEGSDG